MTISIIIGIITYSVCNLFLARQSTPVNENFIGEQVSLQDENVQILYNYVTYGAEGKRYLKFVTEREVTIASFSDEEKLYYALQFAQAEDFKFTGEMTSEKQKIYLLSNTKVREYMNLFFGTSVTYKEVPSITYPFTFQINKMNVGTMTYNSNRNGYDTVFASYKDVKENKGIESVYGELSSAIKRADGGIVLQEKVIYTEFKTDGNGYSVDVYKDPEKTILLETITGITEDALTTTKIDLSKYPSLSIVEYSFFLDGTILCFEGSRIIT